MLTIDDVAGFFPKDDVTDVYANEDFDSSFCFELSDFVYLPSFKETYPPPEGAVFFSAFKLDKG